MGFDGLTLFENVAVIDVGSSPTTCTWYPGYFIIIVNVGCICIGNSTISRGIWDNLNTASDILRALKYQKPILVHHLLLLLLLLFSCVVSILAFNFVVYVYISIC